MKKNRILSVTIILAGMLALVSCNTNDNDNTLQPTGPQPIQFTAGIGQPVVANPNTRALGTMWNDGDAIGIFMVDHGTTTISPGATNRKFVIDAKADKFQAVLGDEIYYPMDAANTVDFIAYYPHRANATLDTALPVSTTDQSAQTTFDLLWATADNTGLGYNKDEHAETPIPLNFAHRLAKLTMNCTAEANTGYADLDKVVVTIRGMYTATTFNPKTGMLGTSATQQAFSPRRATTPTAGALATFDAIIIPANYAANQLTVTFTISDETYTWDVDPIEFESGKEYIYQVILTRTGVTATGTIIPWETVTPQKDPVFAN